MFSIMKVKRAVRLRLTHGNLMKFHLMGKVGNQQKWFASAFHCIATLVLLGGLPSKYSPQLTLHSSKTLTTES